MPRQAYTGHLNRYRDPEARVAEMSERRRRRKAEDPEYRERLRAQGREHRALGQQRASMAISRAIKRGEIVRPETCEECGRDNTLIEAAHHDYSKPLDVRWLCRSCHRRWDRDEPKTTEADRLRVYAPRDPERHDVTRYQSGCRCDICRQANTEYCREQRRKRRERIDEALS